MIGRCYSGRGIPARLKEGAQRPEGCACWRRRTERDVGRKFEMVQEPDADAAERGVGHALVERENVLRGLQRARTDKVEARDIRGGLASCSSRQPRQNSPRQTRVHVPKFCWKWRLPLLHSHRFQSLSQGRIYEVTYGKMAALPTDTAFWTVRTPFSSMKAVWTGPPEVTSCNSVARGCVCGELSAQGPKTTMVMAPVPVRDGSSAWGHSIRTERTCQQGGEVGDVRRHKEACRAMSYGHESSSRTNQPPWPDARVPLRRSKTKSVSFYVAGSKKTLDAQCSRWNPQGCP